MFTLILNIENVFKQITINKGITCNSLLIMGMQNYVCGDLVPLREVNCHSLENDCINSALGTEKLQREPCHNYQGVRLDCSLYLQFPSALL